MKNYSIWLDDIKTNPSPKLNKDIDVDILIIGGGITGLNIAYQLKNLNLKIALVEKNLIGHGITSRTTGKITFLQETIYSDLAKIFNADIAKKYLDSQILAIKTISDIIKNENLDCNLETVDSYLFTNKNCDIEKIKREKELLERFEIKVNENCKLPDNSKIKYGISVSNTKVFHPLKYVYALKEICAKKIDIYENTKILDIKEKEVFICKTDNNTIKAKQVVLAFHYPYFIFPYLFPFKTHLEKSYIAAYKEKENNKFSAITSKQPTLSMRYYENGNNIYKLVLKESHNLAFKNNDSNHFKDLNSKAEYLWSNKDIITSDKLPLIGKIKENLYLATGYNTWGMTNSIIASLLIKDLILGNENIYEKLFSPKRAINKNKIISFPINITSNIKSFIGSKINKDKSWYNNNIRFIKKNGKNLAIYTDENKKEHIVYNICPHFKCSLIFNEVEKTWDCPCHGSRFDIDGHSIEGPSNFDITYKK